MMDDDGATDAIVRLWCHWAHVVVHDLRTPIGVAHGCSRLLLNAETPEHKRAGLLIELDRRLDQAAAVVAAISACSLGRDSSIGDLVRVLEQVYKNRLTVTRTGDLTIPAPTDHIGLALWVLVAAQAPSSRSITMAIAATDRGGRISIGPAVTVGEGGWKLLTDADVADWWLGNAINVLRASGYVVDTYSNGNVWHAEMTWSVGRTHTGFE